jgi:hypothetical protein
MRRAPTVWTYRGVNVHPAGSNAPSIRWTALVDLPGYAGFLRADTKQGMRELVRHYGVSS